MTRSAAQTDPFQVIAELRGDIAFVIDCRTGLPAYVSPASESKFGYSLADFIAHMDGSKPDGALNELCGGLGDRLRRFVAGDPSRKRLIRRFGQRCRNGRVIPIEVISTLLTDREGQADKLVGLVRDVSDEHERLEEQRRFASMLNHEFRTPLSTIDGAIQRLDVTHAQADAATRQRYRKIGAAVDQLIGMLDHYLSPDRLEQIGYKPRANTIEPRLLLDEAAQHVRAAGRAVQLHLGDLPATLRCQPDGLRMAIKVLVDNAVRYAPEGTPIELGGELRDGGLALTVSDQGPGVPEDEISHIFGKAYRARNAIGPGAGLGLYMAKSVIEVHGGAIQARNVAPTGAEFQIWLPIQRPSGKYVASEVINCDNSVNQLAG